MPLKRLYLEPNRVDSDVEGAARNMKHEDGRENNKTKSEQ